ncbi:hypothetical protein EV677_0748 [Herminiimonas fonticola]|uniref:Uncharacterized protein n=1 Tax=Herminiimonas fonticola TaxID=303380 RepID=A0A4R6GH04_9BURK|nr:hypothetical protein Hfont_0724 [Herminiimonas fonticola]TDN94206.1 hypothetical protein EV677_0748 [Herminiimonas fonticola]
MGTYAGAAGEITGACKMREISMQAEKAGLHALCHYTFKLHAFENPGCTHACTHAHRDHAVFQIFTT